MRNILYKFSVLLFGLVAVSSCTENEIPTIDINGERALASFSGASETQAIVFNPASETENVITVGVSTLSETDRQVQITLNEEESTLDPAFYTISTLTPVIAAGEFTADIVITTLPGEVLPDPSDVVVLELTSVEGAIFEGNSVTDLTLGLSIECPTVEMANIPGTYAITVDDFGTYLGDGTLEVVAGPGENQFTLVNPFDHPNPDAGGEQNYEVVFTVNPDSGTLTVARQNAWHYSNFVTPDPYGVGRVEGTGQVLTCINQINFNLTHTVGAGSFGTYALTIVKQ